MRRFTHTLIACLAATLAFSAQAATKIIVGTVPNTSDGPIICAIEKGYFKEQDIEVELTSFRTASDMTPMVVRGDIPIMGGGVSVSYFNGVAQGMPLRYFLSRAQIRSHHKIILRKGLAEKVKTIADLKGLRIATTAAGGFSEYELGKALETAGLTLDDVDTKPLAMPQTLTAMINGAIDAAVLIPPFDGGALRDGATMLVRLDQSSNRRWKSPASSTTPNGPPRTAICWIALPPPTSRARATFSRASRTAPTATRSSTTFLNMRRSRTAPFSPIPLGRTSILTARSSSLPYSTSKTSTSAVAI